MKQKRPILSWLVRYSYFLILSILAIMVSTYFRSSIPQFYKYAVDNILKPDPESSVTLPKFIADFVSSGDTVGKQLIILGSSLVVIQIIRAVFSLFSGWNNANYSETIAYKTRTSLYGHIQNLSYSYHNKTETGDLIQRSTSDVEVVRRFVGAQMPEIFNILFLFFFTLIQMFRINIQLTLISLIIVPIIFFFAFNFFKKVQKIFTTTDEAEAAMSTALQENLTGIRVVKAFAKEKYEIEKFDQLNAKYRDHVYEITQRMARYWSTSDFLIYIQVIGTIIIGAMFVIRGQMSLGDLIAFSTMVHMILWPIRQLGRIIVDFGKCSVAIKRIEEILNEPDEYEEKGLDHPEIQGEIEFQNMSFTFPDATVPTLKDISFKIKPGQTVAILGKTGSGKSTLAHLLVRLYDYTDGSILIDGQELKTIDKQWVRKHIGVILQEPFLYSRSIAENVGILAKAVNEEEIVKATKIAHVHEDIEEFELGYKTIIGERGVTLSGGQRQRVAIARMLVKDYPVLIFDDSLSAVDTETDMAIRKALAERDGMTRLIITHRVATAMEADQIIVLDQGEVVESGTHEDLMLKDGIYRRIWDIQNMVKEDFHVEFNGGDR